MAVLITGGAGAVGSHLVDRCVSQGEEVIVLDNLSTGRISNLEEALSSGRVTFVCCDVAQPVSSLRDIIAEALSGQSLERIYHLASPASPEAYGAHPWETLLVNGIGTMSLIDIALEYKSLMLFASTSEVYGDPLVHPQPETYFGNVNSVGPRACYDEGKRFGEAAMSVAVASRGLDGRIVRIFNCYGPRMQLGDGRLIPSMFQAYLRDEPLPIHGTGEQTRSMTYVADLIEGLLTVASWESAVLQPVNLGRDEECSVLEIAHAISAINNKPLTTVSLPARPEDPQRRRPDTSLARSIGWNASTPLSEGLRKTYEWLTTEAPLYA